MAMYGNNSIFRIRYSKYSIILLALAFANVAFAQKETKEKQSNPRFVKGEITSPDSSGTSNANGIRLLA